MDNRHFYAVGRSGFGKSTLLKNKIFDDLDRSIFFLDPHGDDARDLLDALPPRTRERICYFDLSASAFPSFDPILPPWHAISPFQTIWKDSWGPRLNYQLYHALAAVHDAGLTLADIPRLFHDKPFRLKTLARVHAPATLEFWTEEYPSWPPRQQQEAAIALYNKVGILLASPVVKAITPRRGHATYDFEKALAARTITIVNLAKGAIGDETAHLFAALFIATFRHALLNHPTDCLFVADEFQNYGADIFVSMLSEMRKFGLQLGLAHQFASQIEPRLLDAILGNVRDTYVFNVQHKDAMLLSASMNTLMQDFTADLAALPPYFAYANGERRELPPFDYPRGNLLRNITASALRFHSRARSSPSKGRSARLRRP